MNGEVQDVVRARRFELVGEQDRVCAALYSDSDGSVALTLIDADSGKLRAELAIVGGGQKAVLNLRDSNENRRVSLEVYEAGAHVSLRDEVQRIRTQMYLEFQGERGAGLSIADQGGNTRVLLYGFPDGASGLGFYDAEGNVVGP